MTRRGFTIVELIITITIMGILLTLAVVNVNSTQMKARDNERKADIEAITGHLETFYKVGIDSSTSYYRYPTTTNLINGSSTTGITTYLRDADLKSFTAPTSADAVTSFIAATNNTQTAAGVTPQPAVGQYVYQPILASGALCTGSVGTDCRKYNLYYKLESDNVVYMVTSKNQ